VDSTQALLLTTLTTLAADIWSIPPTDSPLASTRTLILEVHNMVEDPFLTANTLFKTEAVVEALHREEHNYSDESVAYASSGVTASQPVDKKRKCE
jgi:pentose-5-phosphate-3-epimerase